MSKTKLRIHTWPEKILKKKCKKVEKVNNRIKELLDEMLALMRVNSGVGLAGNQAGLDLNLIVIEFDGKVYKLVNPRVVKAQGQICFREGCLSFPGLEIDVKRHKKVTVKALDEQGKPLDINAEGILAVILQHEIDHIRGVVFIDRISLWQRIKALPKLRAIKKKTRRR